jgi:hypothetical protein
LRHIHFQVLLPAERARGHWGCLQVRLVVAQLQWTQIAARSGSFRSYTRTIRYHGISGCKRPKSHFTVYIIFKILYENFHEARVGSWYIACPLRNSVVHYLYIAFCLLA